MSHRVVWKTDTDVSDESSVSVVSVQEKMGAVDSSEMFEPTYTASHPRRLISQFSNTVFELR